MTLVVKAERRTVRRRRQASPAPPVASASPQARRQAATILEVLAGVRRPSEAAQVLEISLPRYYQLEQRALAGLVTACEPAPRGPRVDLMRRIAALEREKGRLQRECDRQQALVRAAQRSLGLPGPAKPPAAGKEVGTNSSGKRRRNRRPSVRALKAVRALQVEEVVLPGEQVVSEVAATPTSAAT